MNTLTSQLFLTSLDVTPGLSLTLNAFFDQWLANNSQKSPKNAFSSHNSLWTMHGARVRERFLHYKTRKASGTIHNAEATQAFLLWLKLFFFCYLCFTPFEDFFFPFLPRKTSRRRRKNETKRSSVVNCLNPFSFHPSPRLGLGARAEHKKRGKFTRQREKIRIITRRGRFPVCASLVYHLTSLYELTTVVKLLTKARQLRRSILTLPALAFSHCHS